MFFILLIQSESKMVAHYITSLILGYHDVLCGVKNQYLSGLCMHELINDLNFSLKYCTASENPFVLLHLQK